MSFAPLLRALPDDALLSFVGPTPALIATLLRQLPDEELDALYAPAPIPTDDEPAAEPDPTPIKPRRPRAEVTDELVAQVGTAIDEASGSVPALAERTGLEPAIVRAAVSRLVELGLVRKIGVGRYQAYEAAQPAPASTEGSAA